MWWIGWCWGDVRCCGFHDFLSFFLFSTLRFFFLSGRAFGSYQVHSFLFCDHLYVHLHPVLLPSLQSRSSVCCTCRLAFTFSRSFRRRVAVPPPRASKLLSVLYYTSPSLYHLHHHCHFIEVPVYTSQSYPYIVFLSFLIFCRFV